MRRTVSGYAVALVAAAIAILPVIGSTVRAEQISTTSCKAVADRTKTQGGKTYNCTGCEACTTTTCTTGGPASCTNTTTTSCTCTEAASASRPLKGIIGVQPEVLAPDGGTVAPPKVGRSGGKVLLRQ